MPGAGAASSFESFFVSGAGASFSFVSGAPASGSFDSDSDSDSDPGFDAVSPVSSESSGADFGSACASSSSSFFFFCPFHISFASATICVIVRHLPNRDSTTRSSSEKGTSWWAPILYSMLIRSMKSYSATGFSSWKIGP